MKRKSMQITLPNYVNDYLYKLMGELGSNKSEVIEKCIFYVSQNYDDFMSQFVIENEEEEELEEEEEEEEEEDEEEDS